MGETLRPYKFVVQPVCQLVDGDDNVVGERGPQQPDVVFGLDGLRRYADEFEASLNAQSNGAMARPEP